MSLADPPATRDSTVSRRSRRSTDSPTNSGNITAGDHHREGHPPTQPQPPTAPDLVWCDSGRVQLVAEWEPWLRGAGLTTLAAFRELPGEVVRQIDSRETLRVEIPPVPGLTPSTATAPGSAGRFFSEADQIGSTPVAEPLVVYLKRHGRPRWRERIVPWLRGTRPILGASAEWQALGHFTRAGIPTMQPVAYGADAEGSFVMTLALSARCDLKAWLRERATQSGWSQLDRQRLARVVTCLAGMVRTLHTAGLHHQDLYLNHVLWCGSADAEVPDLRLIDLGRVVQRVRLSRRWRVKDLAQLHFSAAGVPCREQVRFLQLYLGRRLNRGDRVLVRRILRKSARIARHTRRHGL